MKRLRVAAPRYRAPMTEQELLDNIRELALYTGWAVYHTYDARRSEAGWPDLVLAHGSQRRVLFAELKTTIGKLRPQQRVWLDLLRLCGLETALWRPADWYDGTITAVLKGQRVDRGADP